MAGPFRSWQGGIAPWFAQPGGGQRIELDVVFLDPGRGERLNANWLLDHDYLGSRGRAAPAVERRELYAAPSRASVADGYYRVEGVHEPAPPPRIPCSCVRRPTGCGRPVRTSAAPTR